MKDIYLIASTSYHVINRKIQEINKDNDDVTTFSLNDVSIYDCIDDASYFSMFSSKRILVIKDVKYFGGKFNYEEECNALGNFLTNMPDGLTIIFICDTLSKTKEFTKKVLNLGATIYDATTIDDELFLKLVKEYVNDHNITIDDKTIEELKKRSLNNLDIVIQEIDKISNIASNITMDLVNEYGIKLEDLDIFEFSNAVIAKDFSHAFELLDKLLNGGIDAYSIVGTLASSYTNMYMVRDALNYGLSDEEIAKKLGYSGTGRVYVMKKNSKIYTLEDLKSIIISLSDLDIKLKTGYNPVYSIKEFLLNL